MEKMFDVVIVGGGASGIVSAICCAEKGLKVCLLEKATKVGKKILQTGNGRCNLSNQHICLESYNSKIVDEVFEEVKQQDVLNFFISVGIQTFSDEEGRIYPICESSNSVVFALNLKLQQTGVEIFCEEEVETIEKNKTFEIKTTSGHLFCGKKIILACGVVALEKFIKFEELKAQKKVLVGFECSGYEKSLSGIRQDCLVEIESLNFKEKGQVQFKDEGISGIVIFNASFVVAKIGKFPVEINLGLLPNYTEKQIEEKIESVKNEAIYLNVENCLMGIFQPALCKVVLKRSGVNLTKNILKLTKEDIKNIVKTIKHFKVVATKTLGEPQVLAGGFLEENLINLESKKYSGLFVTGEASGVFGKCGGYNLHYAFASGIYVAKRVVEGK